MDKSSVELGNELAVLENEIKDASDHLSNVEREMIHLRNTIHDTRKQIGILQMESEDWKKVLRAKKTQHSQTVRDFWNAKRSGL